VDSIFSPNIFFPPPLTNSTQALIRIAYGVLLLGTLLLALPHWRRFFMSERWGGYAESSRDTDFIQNPVAAPLIAILWLAAAWLITLGRWTVAAALVNLLLCRYFFVRMRWKGVLRGMGAPGFMAYWLAAVIFILEYTRVYAPELRSLALLVAQIDFAFIMLSAGIYKFTAGYARNQGMEGGMVNPQWGYWWWLYQRVRPGHPFFKFMNHMAWSLEVLAGILMLLPPTRFVGSLLMLGSFAFIATQIRLGLLCEMVIVCCFLFFHAGSFGDQLAHLLVPAAAATPGPGGGMLAAVNLLVAGVLWAYLVLLPLAHASLFYNFYAHRALPKFLQRALEIYTNFFGIIIWRVFSADHTNFFVRIYHRPRSPLAGATRTLVSRTGLRAGSWRYNHVAESIVVTTLFTTLKYYPSNNELFRERLLRYARTVAIPPDSLLDFEYVTIRKGDHAFDFAAVAEYNVDVEAGTVNERTLDGSFSVRSSLSVSPVHEGVRPGSYVALKGQLNVRH
jgi:hypothetical protein